MEESFKSSFTKTAYDRLPASVRRLGKNAQTACIHLRLRKSPEAIAEEMGIRHDESALLVSEVRRALISSGNYDMIADPVFVPLDGEDGMEPASNEPAMEDKIMAEKFLSALAKALGELPALDGRLLRLFFEGKMTAKEIAAFLKKAGFDDAPKKETDVFQHVDKALKRVLDSVTHATPIGRGTLTVRGLREILSQTGAGEAVI
ncbi:MAG: hypothetical protein HY280_09490 [Nitrospinae bacterium]|nr:hypothetical protein [Nitrospinota bacterium]